MHSKSNGNDEEQCSKSLHYFFCDKNVSIEADSAVVAACTAFILFNDFLYGGRGHLALWVRFFYKCISH